MEKLQNVGTKSAIVPWGKSSGKGKYFSKRKVVSIVGFGFSQMWKNQ